MNEWLDEFQAHPGYNDTQEITVKPHTGVHDWEMIGVHRLTISEWGGQPTILFDVRTLQGNRHGGIPINFGWEGMQEHEKPHPAYANKPDNEIPTLPIIGKMWIEIYNGDTLIGFGNGPVGSSYYVVFQEVDKTQPPVDPPPIPPNPPPVDPPPSPDPEPDPDPPPLPDPPPAWPTPQQVQMKVVVVSKKQWLLNLPVDENGDISFFMMVATVSKEWISSLEPDSEGDIQFVAPITRPGW